MKKLRLYIFTLIATLITVSCGKKQEVAVANNDYFKIQFIDVGQADSALIMCSGESMLIDGGNVGDSNKIVSVLKKNNISELNYIIATHAHEDHMGGLAGALSVVKTDAIYTPQTTSNSQFYNDFINKAQAQGLTIQHPKVGEKIIVGHSVVNFLAPVDENTNDLNDTSIVLRITYGDNSFLFTGDASREAEEKIISTGYELKSDFLKVGHHGSETSSTYPFLRSIMPKYAVISVGENNKYGHPTEDALSRLRDVGATVYRTDMQGDIFVESDGTNITITPSKGEGLQTVPQKNEKEIKFIGNQKSKVFHTIFCSSLPAEKNSVSFSSRDEAIADGYRACSHCKP